MAIRDILNGYQQVAGGGVGMPMRHNLDGLARKPDYRTQRHRLLYASASGGCFDHMKKWVHITAKSVAVTSEPYHIDMEHINAVCVGFGLKATIYPQGVGDHNEGTYLVVFTKPAGYVLDMRGEI